MGTISYSIPQTGQPDSTEDPKVASALTTLLTLVNGNIDTTNLSSSAAIARSQLATGAAVPLTPVITNVSSTVAVGTVVCYTAGSVTATLPTSPSLGDTVGVIASAGPGTITNATPVTVTAGSNHITLPAATGSGPTSILLGTSYSFWTGVWTGSQWATLSGGEDTGWATISSLGTNMDGSGDGFTASCRRVNGTISFKGALHASGANTGITIATVPSGFRPPSGGAYVPSQLVNGSGTAKGTVVVGSNGVLSTLASVTLSSGDFLPLNGLTYPLS